MTFTHPQFLWFLPLVVVPILLHLLGKRRRHERPFSWVRLLAEAQHEGRYRSRPVEWLILLLRVLAVASVILALAGAHWGPLPAVKTVAIDLSGSTQGLAQEMARVVPVLRQRFPGAQWVYFADRLLPRYQQTHLPTRYRALLPQPVPLVLITDGQATGFLNLTAKNLPWIVVLVGDRQRPNVAIEGVEPQAPYVLQGFPVSLKVRLRNYGAEPARRILSLEGRNRTHQQVLLSPGATVELPLQGQPDEEGRLRVSLAPHDALPCDDRQEVVVRITPALDLAWWGRPSLVLQALLEPEGVPRLFRVQRVRHPTPGQLSAYAVVLIHGAPAPAPSTPLATWIRNPPQRVLVFDASGAWARLLGIPVEDSVMTLKVGTEHLKARPFRAGPGMRILVRSATGKPVVVEQGGVVLFGFLPDQAGTWPLTPEFVQLVYRLAAQGATRIEVLNGIATGTRVRLPLPDGAAPPYRLEGPQGTVPLTPILEGGRPVLEFVPFLEGFYRVLARSDTLARVAVVCPPEESDPTPASPEEWRRHLGASGKVMGLKDFLGLQDLTLTPWLLVAALVFLFLEAVLLRWR